MRSVDAAGTTASGSADNVTPVQAFGRSHFRANRQSLQALARSIPLEPGWRVLAAGCGGDAYADVLASLIGPGGSVEAYPATLAAAAHEPAGTPPANAAVATLQLPYSNGSLDAVWCSHATHYLSNRQLCAQLAEFKRVLRPGGLLCVLDCDHSGWQMQPLPDAHIWHLLEHWAHTNAAVLRTQSLPRWLRDAGFVDVRSHNAVCEHAFPLDPDERASCGAILSAYARIAATLDLAPADREAAAAYGRLDAPDHIFNDPDFTWHEEHILVYGWVG